jgi:transcription initiation factor TFIIB
MATLESLAEKKLDELYIERELSKPEFPKLKESYHKCPECGSSKLVRDYEKAELICGRCGFIIIDKIMDMEPEWRAYDQEQLEKRSRVGAPMRYAIHDKGLSTIIDWRNRDYHGIDLTPKKRREIYRLRKWQKRMRVIDPEERNLASALTEIDRMASKLGLPDNIRETAAVIYRKSFKKGLVQGRTIEGVASAAVYAACRKHDVARTLDEIAEVSYARKKEISRAYRIIAREVPLRLEPTDPITYIPRLASKLGLSAKVQSEATKLLKKAKTKNLTSGRDPAGIAAAAIYIASVLKGERRSQRDVAEVAKITEVTVRNRYKEICEKLGLDLDKEFRSSYTKHKHKQLPAAYPVWPLH